MKYSIKYQTSINQSEHGIYYLKQEDFYSDKSTNLSKTKDILALGKNFDNEYLTKREREVLQHVVLGCTAKKIGQLLNISFRTVEAYIDTLKLKLRCSSKREIIMQVIKSGLINQLNILK